jgi:hypothetical protein
LIVHSDLRECLSKRRVCGADLSGSAAQRLRPNATRSDGPAELGVSEEAESEGEVADCEQEQGEAVAEKLRKTSSEERSDRDRGGGESARGGGDPCLEVGWGVVEVEGEEAGAGERYPEARRRGCEREERDRWPNGLEQRR